MFVSCLIKELRHDIRSLRYVVVLGLLVVLLPGVVIVRTEMYVKQLADHTKRVNDLGELLSHVNSTWDARGIGATALTGPQPLAIFAAGLDNEMSRSQRYWHTDYGWAMPDVGFRRLSSGLFRYGVALDIVFVVSLICSLLGLILAYDTVCGEREDGTLPVLLSGPIPRDTVVLSKIAAGLITAWIPLVVGWGIGLVYVLVVRKVQLTPDQLARVAILIALSMLYVAFFAALGIAVSCLVSRRATALGACIAAWVVLVLTVPNLVPVVARQLSPVPASSKLNTEINSCVRNVWTTEWPKWQETMIPATEYRNWDEYWVRAARERYENYLEESVGKMELYHRTCVLRQIQVNRDLARLSPASLFVNTSTHLASTGMQDYVAHLGDLDEFRRQYRTMISGFELDERRGTATGKFSANQLPVFAPRPEALRAVLNDSWADITLLGGGTVLLLMIAGMLFLRYRVR